MKKLTLLFAILFNSFAFSQDFQITNTGVYSVDIPALDVYNGNASLLFGTNYWFYSFDEDGITSPIDQPIQPSPTAWGPHNPTINIGKNNGYISSVYIDPVFSADTYYLLNYVQSLDGGQNWSSPMTIDTIEIGSSISTRFDSPQAIATNNNNLFILRFSFKNSQDTTAIYLSNYNGPKIRVDENAQEYEWAMSMFVVPNTTWESVYITYVENNTIYLKKIDYSFGGEYTSYERKPITYLGQVFMQYDNFTKLLIDSNGKMYLFYNYYPSAGVYLVTSTDEGNSWTNPQKVINSPNQWVNDYVSFNITSNDILTMVTHNTDNGNVYSKSSINGINWTETAYQVNSSNGTVVDFSFQNSVLIGNTHLATAWIDNRTGNEEIFYSKFEIPEVPSTSIHQNEVVDKFELSQNYPNPFNPSTEIKFSIPQDSHVILELFNTLGEKVATLIDKEMSAGSHNYQFSISNYQLPSGIYFYKLQSGSFSETKKMILLK